jgi:glycosyltransferase involved in cell wall biosynthesis
MDGRSEGTPALDGARRGREPLRVLHVSQPTVAGVPHVVASLVRDQVARGWDVSVACPPRGSLPDLVRAEGATHLRWPATRQPGPRSMAEAVRLGRLVASVSPHVVHLHSSKAGLAGRLAIRGRRCTLFQPHGWSFDALHGPLRAAARVWERNGARWADAVVCVSDGERQRGIRAGVEADIRVIPNGIDLASWPPAAPDGREAARAALQLPDAPLVVCVGRLSRAKGQDLLLDAWPAVLRKIPQAQLVLVGDGPNRDSIRRRRAPQVRMALERPDVALWLTAADVVAAPSRWEGMSLVVLEAMAVGRSVVASDAPGMWELLGTDAGAVVPQGDLQGLATALVDRLLDRNRVSAEERAARDRVQQLHGREVMAERIRDLYTEVLDRRAMAAPRGAG